MLARGVLHVAVNAPRFHRPNLSLQVSVGNVLASGAASVVASML